MRSSSIAVGFALALSAVGGRAQTFEDLTLVRNPPLPYSQLLSVRAGVLGNMAGDQDKAVGLENTLGWDGSVYYHEDNIANREASIDAYAGRYAALLSLREGSLVGEGTVSRLDVHARYFPFYREGFYSSGNFVPTGRYKGLDYGLSLSLGRELTDGLFFDGGIFWERRTFKRSGATPANYVIPDNYNAYGARIWLEHNTVVLDRTSGRPVDGFIFTVGVEREQNDSDRTFGTAGTFQSSLPSGIFRGRGHLEWYFPQGDAGAWQLIVDGRISTKKDRVNNFDAYRPLGELWVDAEFGFRWDITDSIWVTPSFKGQYLRVRNEAGTTANSEIFYGGGVEAGVVLSEMFSIHGEYSYLSNESRAPVSVTEDTFGEHQFFLGLEVRLVAQER